MKVLNGNKIETLDHNTFKNRIKDYNSVTIDIGTGDGSFPYRKARKDKDSFYIGIDAVADNMVKNAVKANMKPSKGGLGNLLFVVDNALNIPDELANQADHICINLPWGSLMDGVVKGDEKLLHGIRKISKPKAGMDIYITYSSLYEANEISSRGLPALSTDYIETELERQYSHHGIYIKKVELCNNDDLKGLDTSWAKKLAFGRKREIYHLKCMLA